MPTIPCPTQIDCQPCNDEPILNISAEASDVDRYISRFSFLSPFPPIRQFPDFDEQGGGIFLQIGCMRWCWSTISQDDADDCARRQAIECAFQAPIPPPDEFHPNRISLYYNQAVTGTYICPDGNVFSYTIAANQIVALTQGEANAIAFALAKFRARQHRVCISDMDDPICVDTWATKQITASGPNVAVFPATDRWELVSGTIPDGMTLETGFTSDGITFSGIPTTIGEYAFRVRCTISTFGSPGFGDFMEKVFTVRIVGIEQSSPLPDAPLGVAYSQQLSASFSSNHALETWSITSGSLPDGLTLSTAGLISGTPTGALAGYSFTVQAQFPVGSTTAVCSKQMSITVTVVLPTPTEYWSFDGSTYFGEIANTFFVNTDTVFVAAKHNEGVHFNDTPAINAELRVSNSPLLNFQGNSFVASCWFREVIKPVGLVPAHNLFDCFWEDAGGTFVGAVAVRIKDGNVLRLQVTEPDFSNNIVDVIYDPGLVDFHLMALTYSRVTGLAILRIDNVILATSSAPKFVGASTQADFFVINRANSLPLDGEFEVDEVSLWFNDEDFQQAQFDLLWNGGAGTFWPF